MLQYFLYLLFLIYFQRNATALNWLSAILQWSGLAWSLLQNHQRFDCGLRWQPNSQFVHIAAPQITALHDGWSITRKIQERRVKYQEKWFLKNIFRVEKAFDSYFENAEDVKVRHSLFRPTVIQFLKDTIGEDCVTVRCFKVIKKKEFIYSCCSSAGLYSLCYCCYYSPQRFSHFFLSYQGQKLGCGCGNFQGQCCRQTLQVILTTITLPLLWILYYWKIVIIVPHFGFIFCIGMSSVFRDNSKFNGNCSLHSIRKWKNSTMWSSKWLIWFSTKTPKRLHGKLLFGSRFSF